MFRRAIKITFTLTVLFSVCIVASPFFIPEHKYHALVEELISEGMDREVKIAKLKYQLFPLPHIEGSNITIMSNQYPGEAVIGHVSVWFNYRQLIARQPQIEHLHFNGVATNQAFFESFLAQQKQNSQDSASPYITIKRISAASVSLRDKDNKLLPAFRFDGSFGDNNLFSELSISLLDHNLEATVTPVNDTRFQIRVNGDNFVLPTNSSIPIKQFSANAFYENNALSVSKFQIQNSQVQLDGQLKLENPNSTWLASGSLNITDSQLAALNPFLTSTEHPPEFNGKLNARLNFASSGDSFEDLIKFAIIKGQFSAINGAIKQGRTLFKFDKVNGDALVDEKTAIFNNMHGQLYSGTLTANNVQIKGGKQWLISGEIKPSKIDFSQLSQDLFDSAPLSGKASGTIRFSAKAAGAHSLIEKLQIRGDLAVSTPRLSFEGDDDQTHQLTQLDSIDFNGLQYTSKGFFAKKLNISGYDGTLHASDFSLSQSPQWTLNSQIETQNLSLAPLIEHLGFEACISGHLNSKHSIRASADSFETLFEVMEAAGDFEISNGVANTASGPSSKQFKFKRAHGQGKFNKHQMTIPKLNITAYDGNVIARDLLLSHNENEWAFFSHIESNEVALEPLLRDTIQQQIIAGKVGGHVTLALNGPQLDELFTRMDARGRFYITDGLVYNTDIEQAVSMTGKQETGEDVTEFSELSSKFEIVNNQIELSKLRINSANLSGKGNVTISPEHKLTGTLDVAVRSTGNLLKVPLNVSGTIDEPEFALTGGALVGSAVGTSVLGPGLGTFIGLHTGKLFTGIGNLFTRRTN